MGSVKDRYLEEQAFRGIAEHLCDRAGLVSICDHGTVFMQTSVPQEERHRAYARAEEGAKDNPHDYDYESLVEEIDVALSNPNA